MMGGLALLTAISLDKRMVDPVGPLTGRVVAARATPEATRLLVDVAGVGELAAVAAAPAPGPGEDVRLAVDPARLAVIPVD